MISYICKRLKSVRKPSQNVTFYPLLSTLFPTPVSLIRSDLEYGNVHCDTSDDIGEINFGNLYAHFGSDGLSRANRESFCAETIPNLLLNSQPHGCLGGDLNMIIDKYDAPKKPETKISPTFKRLVCSISWFDSF